MVILCMPDEGKRKPGHDLVVIFAGFVVLGAVGAAKDAGGHSAQKC